MKRLHIHVAVDDLARAIPFYETLFASAPSVVKGDYAKWMLDDPRVNFAISARGAKAGVEHLGIQVEDGDELAEIYGRLERADAPVLEEGETVCCYARSEKSWVTDPAGVPWEVFHTHGEAASYGGGAVAEEARLAVTPTGRPEAACCAPAKPAASASASCC